MSSSSFLTSVLFAFALSLMAPGVYAQVKFKPAGKGSEDAAPASTKVAPSQKSALHRRALALPDKVKALTAANEKKLEGSTRDMVEGNEAIGIGILKEFLDLSVASDPKADRETLESELSRDAQGVAANLYYDRFARGDGGTMTQIEASAAVMKYYEVRLCNLVTEIFQNDDTFPLEKWYESWEAAGCSTGGSREEGVDEEPTQNPDVSFADGRLKLGKGKIGGTFWDFERTLPNATIAFGARPGQHLTLATFGLTSTLEKADAKGKFVPFANASSAHAVTLPESKGNQYRIRFSDTELPNEETVQLLIELK